MVLGGKKNMRVGWFLKSKVPEEYNPPQTKDSGLKNKRTGFLKQIYNLTFLQSAPLFSHITFSQVTICALYLAINVILSFLFNPRPTANPKRFGFLAIANLPVLILLSMKNTPLAIVPLAYHQLNYLHRFSAFVFILLSSIHGILMIKLGLQAKVTLKLVHYTGVVMFSALFIILFSSLNFIRRRFYTTFYIIHVVGYITVFVGAYYHGQALRPYVLSAIILHLSSSLWQVLKWKKVTASLTALPGKFIKVEISGLKTGWIVGQHVRVRMMGRKLQAIQSHPFTIASVASKSHEDKDCIILYIKAVGDFTTMLYARAITVDGFKEVEDSMKLHASINTENSDITNPACLSRSHTSNIEYHEKEEAATGAKFTLNVMKKILPKFSVLSGAMVDFHVEGPYGGIGWKDFENFKNLFICIGGSGISFLLALISHVLSSAQVGITVERVMVLFVVRERETAQYFAEILQNSLLQAKEFNLRLDIRFFITNKAETITSFEGIKLQWRRPDISTLMKEFLIDVRDLTGVGVLGCGPPELMKDIRSAVSMVKIETSKRVGGIDVHMEPFGYV
ncbi:hypothetical protein PPACK8108_LOCUS20441 [Phakopsora pachyrhizi]|uniref:FAD-binding FR-type domain-containing protein n=1 Tax=Phakopsora pachyrhizi TaxID=170000 RepID=A0AAV0BGV9_PHAPC|nr:hypothetical protein PPACK8108_LOCUS20441 [Phakopsora pachyrhizi]